MAANILEGGISLLGRRRRYLFVSATLSFPPPAHTEN